MLFLRKKSHRTLLLYKETLNCFDLKGFIRRTSLWKSAADLSFPLSTKIK